MSRWLTRAFNPFEHRLSSDERAVRVLRASCLGIVLLVVPYGWLFHLYPIVTADPMAARWLISALAGLVIGWSFRRSVDATWVRRTHLVFTTGVLVYISYLTWANDFEKGYALGLMFTYFAVALSHSLISEHLMSYLQAHGLTTLVVMLFVAFPQTPGPAKAILVLSVLATAVLLYASVRTRFAMMTDLAESERHLAEAQEAAALGSWQTDPATGETHWTPALYRLLGLDPATRPAVLDDSIHPDDLPAFRALVPGGAGVTLRYRRAGSAVWRYAEVQLTLAGPRADRSARVFGTLHDSTDAHAREAALHEAILHAEAAAAAKSTFLANMSHEIRTPLTAILGYAHLLHGEVDEPQRGLVEPIVSGGERLLTTLNSVLDFARMEAGDAGLLAEPVDVAAEIASVVGLLHQRAAAKGLALRADVPDAPLWIAGDAAAVSRVLTNLVSNAIKFTSRGEVVVAAAPVGRTGRITVRDTGRGMEADFLAHLFEPFRQASTGWARSHEGTGLGLAIVKGLVDAMHGSITVESAPRVGTCFTVTLPLASGYSARTTRRVSTAAPAATRTT